MTKRRSVKSLWNLWKEEKKQGENEIKQDKMRQNCSSCQAHWSSQLETDHELLLGFVLICRMNIQVFQKQLWLDSHTTSKEKVRVETHPIQTPIILCCPLCFFYRNMSDHHQTDLWSFQNKGTEVTGGEESKALHVDGGKYKKIKNKK